MSSEAEPAERPARRGRRWIVDLALMLDAFVLCTVAAELAGAANLGTSLTVGQLGFTLVAVYVLLRR